MGSHWAKSSKREEHSLVLVVTTTIGVGSGVKWTCGSRLPKTVVGVDRCCYTARMTGFRPETRVATTMFDHCCGVAVNAAENETGNAVVGLPRFRLRGWSGFPGSGSRRRVSTTPKIPGPGGGTAAVANASSCCPSGAANVGERWRICCGSGDQYPLLYDEDRWCCWRNGILWIGCFGTVPWRIG